MRRLQSLWLKCCWVFRIIGRISRRSQCVFPSRAAMLAGKDGRVFCACATHFASGLCVLTFSSSDCCSSGWDSTGLRPACEKPHCDTHHYVAWRSSFTISAQAAIMKTPLTVLPLLRLMCIISVLFVRMLRMSAPRFSKSTSAL